MEMINIVEKFSILFDKVKIIIHKFLNFPLYKNGVILFGIPKLIYRSKINIAKDVRINDGVYLHGAGGIEIKKNTTLSYGTTILSTGYDTSSRTKLDGKIHKDEKIVIGENIWIGANTTILGGVKIADNCIVGAGSLVNNTLKESNCLYAGVPAKKIKKI